MPSSRPNTIPTVIHLVRQLKPRSVLDVGIGFGKWGHLFREYTDILEAERDPARYQRPNWQVRIDGIEGHAPYVTDMHRYLYNEIHIGNACELIKTLPQYDLIFAGDIIEHFEKAAGMEFLKDVFKHANRAVIVTTPEHDTGQEDLCGNELERHRSVWHATDFASFPNAIVKAIDGTLLAVLPKTAMPHLVCAPPPEPSQSLLKRLAETRSELQGLTRDQAPFILVDEEQFRSQLPQGSAIPFLERDGQYWGLPPDDATAIAELERLRAAGAKAIVFIWSTFWWLHSYSGLRAHLESRYAIAHESENLRVFKLAG